MQHACWLVESELKADKQTTIGAPGSRIRSGR